MRESSHELSPTGQGNVVSIEFNLLYRWHATLSQPDTEWTTRSFSHAFPGKDISKVSWFYELRSSLIFARRSQSKNLMKQLRVGYPIHPRLPNGNLEGENVQLAVLHARLTWYRLKRDKSNRFKDEDLANILHNATEAPAAAFKARGIPESLRVIEILGIEQSRAWRACSVCYVSVFQIPLINPTTS